MGLPTFIVEGNVLAGRTNRWLARFVSKIGVAFETTRRQFPVSKTVLTGLPLRAGIVAPPDVTAQKARSRFMGLSPERFTVVVIGGSQGAKAINTTVLEAADRLIAANIQIVHQTGPKNFDEVKTTAAKRGLLAHEGYLPLPFLNETQVTDALRAADIVVCRGGISTLSETLANGLPCVIVPLPTAYADHQTVNAQALVDAGAAILLPQIGLTGEKLATELLQLRDDTPRREAMAAASCGLGRPDAADAVAREVIALIDQSRTRR
jgi:UDP-N-acetylglucosamine--N-acetylmuramyl-(pentapeptide) pyrophosphoryl-undecaprenol N-acetylglucosamine transferase